MVITPLDPNEMPSKLSFGQPEAKGACANLSLTTVDYGRYLVVMRSAFDVMISGEPYLALMLLLDMDTGNFLTRYGCINQVTMYSTTDIDIDNLLRDKMNCTVRCGNCFLRLQVIDH